MINWFNHLYPYSNLHELNLDWVINTVKTLEGVVNNFVTENTIKYADPIQWNITKQYEKNTVVVDPLSGTAYISSKPVPSGIGLNNTEYWAVIFTLDIISANKNITLRDDANNMLATFESNIGDWLLWNGTLYVVARKIDVGNAYVKNYNINRATVEYFVKLYITEVKNLIGDLTNLTTDNKANVVNSINELVTKLNAEAQNRSQADTQLQTNIDNEVTARQQADTQLQTNIDNEVTARQQADTQLQTNIDLTNQRITRDFYTQISPIKKYIFVGDSYAVGYVPGGSETEGGIVGFYNRVINTLNIPNEKYQLVRYGRAGFLGVGINNKTWYQDVEDLSNDNDVTDIYVMGGMNDVGTNLTSLNNAIRDFIALCKTKFPNGRVHIGFCGRCSISSAPYNIVNIRSTIRVYREASIKYGGNYLNKSENILKAPSTMASDNYHPNNLGQDYLSYYIINHILGRQPFLPNIDEFTNPSIVFNKQATSQSPIVNTAWGFLMDDDTVTFANVLQQGFFMTVNNHQLIWDNRIELCSFSNCPISADPHSIANIPITAIVNSNYGNFHCSGSLFFNNNVLSIGLECLNPERTVNPTVNISAIYIRPFCGQINKNQLC